MKFTSHERMSELFEIEVELTVEIHPDILLSLGKPVCITVYELNKPVRYFHGLLAEAHHIKQDGQGHHYDVTIRPWPYLLGHNMAYRIFEEMTAVEIIKSVLKSYSGQVDYSKLTGKYLKWPYCTQYRESDLAFIMRIMEREGIYFYFRHEKTKHVMVLADSRNAHKPSPRAAVIEFRPDTAGGTGTPESFTSWHEHVMTGGERRVLVQSFDYEKTIVRQGDAKGVAKNPADKQEIHDYLGDFVDPKLAQHWAQMRLESAQAWQRYFTGSGEPIGIACGGRFTLDPDPYHRGGEYIVAGLDYTMEAERERSGGNGMRRRHISIVAVTGKTKWRAPIVTPAPIAGPETAIVIEGGADDAKVDKMGRVRVRFLWKKTDETEKKARSCWLRVSHPSAGASFGHVTLPRKDEEVVVDFLNGDPNRPIVTGRVYNSTHKHAYALPAQRTRSLYRSHTIGKMGNYIGAEVKPKAPFYNELSFDDKGGAEEVYLRAQRNRKVEVLLDDDEKVRRDQANRVGRDRKSAIKRNDSTTVETGNHKLNVVRGSSTTTATQRILMKVGKGPSGSRVLLTPATITAAQGESRMVMTSASITLTVGQNVISISQAGIALNGVTITGNSLTELTWEGTLSTIHGKTMVNVLGGGVTIE